MLSVVLNTVATALRDGGVPRVYTEFDEAVTPPCAVVQVEALDVQQLLSCGQWMWRVVVSAVSDAPSGEAALVGFDALLASIIPALDSIPASEWDEALVGQVPLGGLNYPGFRFPGTVAIDHE